MIQFEEKAESPRVNVGSQARAERLYWVSGTDNEVVARTAIEAFAPTVYDVYGDASIILWRQAVSCEPSGNSTDLWDVTVQYGIERPTDESQFNFEISVTSQRIFQSLATRRYAPIGEIAPDYKGAIGVTADSVEGCELSVPSYSFSEVHYVPNVIVSSGYKVTLGKLVGKTNNAPFKGWDTGEVLMVGASGTARPARGDWEIAYKFSARENVTNQSIGDITGIDIGGWEYVWVRYEDKEDQDAAALVRRPLAVYVEKVYRSGDFSALGIGT